MTAERGDGLTRMASRLPVIALMLALACSSVPRFQCPEQGGAEWHEYRSEHFTVATDGPDGKAAALLRWMERLRASDLLALVGEQVEIAVRMGKCPEAMRLIHRAARIDELKRGTQRSQRAAEIQSRCATQGASR